MKILSCTQHTGGKFRMVRRIGEKLRLQTKAAAADIAGAILPAERAVQAVSGIELHAGQIGFYSKHPAAFGIIYARSLAKASAV